MMFEHIRLVLIAAGALGLAYRFAMGINPSGRFFRLMERSVSAVVLLYVWNLAAPTAIHLGINPITLVFAALAGTPGMAAMAAVKLMH
ncbi:MAG: pro-sigmaK processing inhibitor BofA family protein [Clostridia bacterium]|nr:pro-sigmaK processing inhibitor BofA family protein [Clostridia bacterium]